MVRIIITLFRLFWNGEKEYLYGMLKETDISIFWQLIQLSIKAIATPGRERSILQKTKAEIQAPSQR